MCRPQASQAPAPLAVGGAEAGWGLGPALSSALGCTLGGGGGPWVGAGRGTGAEDCLSSPQIADPTLLCRGLGVALGSAWLCVPLSLLSRTPPRAPFPTLVSGLVGEAAFEKSRGLRGEGARERKPPTTTPGRVVGVEKDREGRGPARPDKAERGPGGMRRVPEVRGPAASCFGGWESGQVLS